jgi:hypothetical protein
VERDGGREVGAGRVVIARVAGGDARGLVQIGAGRGRGRLRERGLGAGPRLGVRAQADLGARGDLCGGRRRRQSESALRRGERLARLPSREQTEGPLDPERRRELGWDRPVSARVEQGERLRRSPGEAQRRGRGEPLSRRPRLARGALGLLELGAARAQPLRARGLTGQHARGDLGDVGRVAAAHAKERARRFAEAEIQGPRAHRLLVEGTEREGERRLALRAHIEITTSALRALAREHQHRPARRQGAEERIEILTIGQ